MDCEQDNSCVPRAPGNEDSRSAVNSLVLDYYKKFGRKRDLEQYFSLSTAQSDIRDPSSVFWARMKAENESSDSGERSDTKKSDSSQELCRISIRFPAQDPSTSQEEDSKTKTESTSPPIIIEELPQDSRQNSEDEGVKSDDDLKSDDNNSQKSYDVILDTSLNKLHSPSSSITSQRRLEWDSLADVGYANESDRKTSASSLSTLERLALKQQYSNNDTQNSNLGIPTAHSTPLDENNAMSRSKKGIGKKSTKIYNKDVDFVEVNVPHSSNMNPGQSINVNLTKHISFNVEKDGKVTVDNMLKNISVSPEKNLAETETSVLKMDREMQTSLTKASNLSSSIPDNVSQQKIPILISLNTLRSRVRRRRLRMARRKLKTKKRADKGNEPAQEKSGEQLSEAESFEYMPGHIYNQNRITANNRPANTAPPPPNTVDNKSSLESSGILTSDSSKSSKHSFTKDLEKSINLLKSALKQRCDDSTLRKQLIQQVCQRLLSSRYRDDDSTTDFLSGLSFSSKKLGLGERNNTTTSTSDANNSAEKSKRPKKSILRTDKFNAGSIASTSQSVPNLPVASKSDNLVTTNLAKNLTSSNTESDMSSKEKTSSDNRLAKTSSEELYKRYLQALKKEEAYKKHLKDKEMFLKQKLVCSDGAFKVPVQIEVKPNNRLNDLIKDLTRNNYDDGSGDASKLEGGPSSHRDFDRFLPNRVQRSHSVFTLSSGISDGHNKKPNLKKKLQCDMKDLSKPGPSKDGHYCCCPHHGNLKFAESSVQVNIKNACSDEPCPARQNKIEPKSESRKRSAKIISDDATGNLKYVCLCSKDVIQEAPDDFLVYKCSRLNNKGVQLQETSSKSSNEVYVQCNNDTCDKRNLGYLPPNVHCLNNKSSQTNMLIKMLHEQPTDSFIFSGDRKHMHTSDKIGKIDDSIALKSTTTVYEATRWIQTEISINPKISEPTLSDINIVSDSDCARLISEHCREVPKASLTDVYSNRAVASTSAFSDSCKSTGTSKDIGKNIRNYEETDKIRKENNQETNIEQSENFTIPIHGTNMTLMVSIGSERTVFPSRNTKGMVTECIGTDKVNAIEQATSLREECSKGVQSDKISDNSETVDRNKNNADDIYTKKSKMGDSTKRLLEVNTCLTADKASFGTYPLKTPVNERKPLRRANTDTDKVNSGISALNVRAGENETQTRSSIITQESSEYNPNHLDTCPCGCKGKIEKCKLECNERTLLAQIKIAPLDKEIATQIDSIERGSVVTPRHQCQKQISCGQKFTPDDFSDSYIDKCPCGCGGNKNTCKKSCKELELSTTNQCGRQPIEQTSTRKNTLSEQSDKCPCGCGGTINTCKRNCKERKARIETLEKRKHCGTEPTDKQIDTETNTESLPRNDGLENKRLFTKQIDTQTDSGSTQMGQCGNQPLDIKKLIQTDMSPTQENNCPCGCGNVKDKCKTTCKEVKLSLRSEFTENKTPCSKQPIDRQIDTQNDVTSTENNLCRKLALNKAIDTQTDNLLTKHVMCSCGCGGEKDKCKKDCKELKSTPRSEHANSRKQCGTQSNIQIDSQTDMPLNEIEKCPCGCGGTNDNCQEDCIIMKLTPREQFRNKDSVAYTAAFVSNEKCGSAKNDYTENCKEVTSTPKDDKKHTDQKEVGTQKNRNESPQNFAGCGREEPKPCTSRSAEVQSAANIERYKPLTIIESSEVIPGIRSPDKSQKSSSETEPTDSVADPILKMIQNITTKYTKSEVEKNKKNKCFKEIMAVLNYLLDTDDSPDAREALRNRRESTTTADETEASVRKASVKSSSEKPSRKAVDKGIQPSSKKPKSNNCATESSEVLTSTDIPATSSDSTACKVLDKIKKECEKYHQKRCKVHGKNCDGTSSTSMNCDQCRRVHHCQCRPHKCKNHKKSTEKMQKSPVAYNLILQTSESVMSEGPSTCEQTRTLKNIIVKVPKKKPHSCMPFRELAAKFEKQMSRGASKDARCCRSKSLPHDSEISSMDEILRQSQGATVREYLEKNRPDFIEKCSQRQTCMRYISESRANERSVKRDLLSLHLAQPSDVTELESAELRRLAAELGRYMRDKQPPKFINEREMKKHSEDIYKSLPEVVQKKEEKRKENIKKTNLLMASMFKRNLQKKTLRGSVNLSNYSSVIKI